MRAEAPPNQQVRRRALPRRRHEPPVRRRADGTWLAIHGAAAGSGLTRDEALERLHQVQRSVGRFSPIREAACRARGAV
jgi:hypothetical protein